jgi:hypothetical protein
MLGSKLNFFFMKTHCDKFWLDEQLLVLELPQIWNTIQGIEVLLKSYRILVNFYLGFD